MHTVSFLIFSIRPKKMHCGSDTKWKSLSLQQDKWHPLLNTVSNVQKYRLLKHSVQGTYFQCSLMATIVEFALKEEPLDVEKMRKCLLKQVMSGLLHSAKK